MFFLSFQFDEQITGDFSPLAIFLQLDLEFAERLDCECLFRAVGRVFRKLFGKFESGEEV